MYSLYSHMTPPLRLEVDSHAQFVAPCVDVASLDQCGEIELDSGAETLGVGHSNLSLVVHLGLCVCVCVCVCGAFSYCTHHRTETIWK